MTHTAKHTPGPWEVNKSDKCLIMVSKEISPRVTQPIADVQYNKERYANAHLIAAAPAMYEALQKISDLYRKAYESDGEFFLDESEIGSLADAALAQAEGRG